jgi:lysophospholipase L1-like esterase
MLALAFCFVALFLSSALSHRGGERDVEAYIKSLLPLPGFIDCSFKSHSENGLYDALLGTRGACNLTKSADITIACVGDSITALGWPEVLQKNLNAKYGPSRFSVINFGECGSTLQRNGDSPYVDRPSWPKVLQSNADIIIIMLGTNDAKDHVNGGPPNWENTGSNSTGLESYSADYDYFVMTFQQHMPNAIIFSAIPPPNYKKGVFGMDAVVINNVYPFLVPHLNRKFGLPFPSIDVFDAMGGINLLHPEWFYDGCHPNVDGLHKLAETMQKGLDL